MEKDPLIGGCVNPKIQEEDNLTPKTLPVDYAYMLLTIKNNMQGKTNAVLSEIITARFNSL